MSLKAKFFKMLGELDDAEKAQLKTFFDGEQDEPTTDSETTDETPQDGAGSVERTPPLEDVETEEKTPQEGKEAVVTMSEDNTELSEEKSEQDVAASNAESDADTVAEQSDGEEVPPMTKEAVSDAEQGSVTEAQAVVDDEGEDMPVDYKEIVDGLNAKIMALEAENAKLRAKTESAFGYSVKPSVGVKANPLFSEDTTDIHFKK